MNSFRIFAPLALFCLFSQSALAQTQPALLWDDVIVAPAIAEGGGLWMTCPKGYIFEPQGLKKLFDPQCVFPQALERLLDTKPLKPIRRQSLQQLLATHNETGSAKEAVAVGAIPAIATGARTNAYSTNEILIAIKFAK